MKRRDYPTVNENRRRLLCGTALTDLERVGAPFVEPDGVHTIDDDLPSHHRCDRMEQRGVPFPRNGEHHDVGLQRDIDIDAAAYASARGVPDLDRRIVG